MKIIKTTVEHTIVELEGHQIPAKIYRERRRTVRFSLAKRGAILRMPMALQLQEQQKEVALFKDWVRKQVTGKQALQDHFAERAYRTGDILQVGNRIYELKVELTENKTHTAKLTARIIHLQLTKHDTDLHRQKTIRHLLSRIVAQDFQAEITNRVIELNRRHFQKPVRSVNLKYNLSNWGSCSTRGNVNLSTRLLFAPAEVIDYVIIHELSHLVEMNHSDRFWQVVGRAMPDFRQQELWLKKNWQLCDF
ncbi:MAG: YgjP-like metallopeptidase domain-containing protein [Bacteroidota bacterium]